jgi:hypothetical protein
MKTFISSPNMTKSEIDLRKPVTKSETIRPKKNMCVSDCMVFKIRVDRSGFFFFFFLNLQVCSFL